MGHKKCPEKNTAGVPETKKTPIKYIFSDSVLFLFHLFFLSFNMRRRDAVKNLFVPYFPQ